MRFSLSLKTLLRTPVKTAVTFLLIAAASFTLFSRVTDYAVTSREMNRTLDYYNGVAALDNGTPFTAYAEVKLNYLLLRDTIEYLWGVKPPPELERELIEAFSSLPGVTMTDTRYMTGGVIEGYRRFYNIYEFSDFNNKYEFEDGREIYGYDYTGIYIMEGTYVGNETKPEHNAPDVHHMTFESCVLIAGDYPISSNGSAVLLDTDIVGGVSLGWNNPGAEAAGVDVDNRDILKEGERYIFFGRYAIDYPSWNWLGNANNSVFGASLFALDELPENYLETEEFAYLREIIDIINKDMNTFDIVYTSDMRAIPRFNEKTMEISEGRLLNLEDHNTNAEVCVVSKLFLDRNNLSVGDKLTIGLGDRFFEQHSGDGAITYLPERQWNVVETVELEIVGAYEDVDAAYQRDAAMYWGYHPCTVFVPLSLLPVEVPADHAIKPGEFSVFIENALDIDAFLEQAEPLAEEMGITLRFSDRGWDKVKGNITTSRTASLLNAVFFVLAACGALLLSAYLYIGRNKKAYAIMRALGTPKRKAGRALSLPLGLLALLAIPVGGVFGIYYASLTVEENLEALSEIGFVNTSLPVAALVLCLVCEIAFIMLITALFLRKMGKTPVLELLQGDVVKVANIAVHKTEKAAVSTSAYFSPLSKAILPPTARRYSALRHVSSYIFRHMRRVKWKTALSLALAAVLTGAIGFLTLTRLSYQELFKEVDVKYTVSNFSSSAVVELSEAELTEDLYYRSNFSASLNASENQSSLTFTNDLERSFPHAEFSVNYADGFSDLSLLNEDAAICLLGSDTAEILGLGAGDSIKIMGFQRVERYFNDFEQGRYDFGIEELIEIIMRESVTYTVAGIIESETGRINTGIFAPLGKTAEKINLEPFPVTHSEFIIADNEKIRELNDYLEELRFSSTQYSSAASFKVDTTELDNIGRVRDLLTLLFPVAVTAAVLIGVTAPSLLILQSSKEAAILRVLGTTKKRVRCMLTFEQVALCIIGIILAAGGLLVYNYSLFTQSAETLALCAVLYLLGCVCAGLVASVSVTKRKILELLQVKE